MQYTTEELRTLPLHLLKNVDIRNADEEKLVQLILDERTVAKGHAPVPFFVSSKMTDDIKTKEDELELQAKIDEYNRTQIEMIGLEEEEKEKCIHCLQVGKHLPECSTLDK